MEWTFKAVLFLVFTSTVIIPFFHVIDSYVVTGFFFKKIRGLGSDEVSKESSVSCVKRTF